VNLHRASALIRTLGDAHGRSLHQNRSYNHCAGFIEPINDRQAAKDAVFTLRFGLFGECNSFESRNFPGFYLRHQNFRIKLSKLDRYASNERDRMDATFCIRPGVASPENKRSWSFVACCFFSLWFIRHRNFELVISYIDDVFVDDTSKKDATFNLMQPTFPFRPSLRFQIPSLKSLAFHGRATCSAPSAQRVEREISG